MDLRQLELFLAVMDTASVTLAAQRMYITPGAVSLQLQASCARNCSSAPESASSRLQMPTTRHPRQQHHEPVDQKEQPVCV